jgi:hypothetical protein
MPASDSSKSEFWKSALPQWQQNLVLRIERALGRELLQADLDCIVWNAAGESLIVEAPPLLQELRARNLISNVFRTRKPPR